MKVAIIGGGIMGSTCAYQALKSNISIQELHIYADKFTDETTSAVAAGIWRGENVGNTPREKIDRWAKASLKHGIDVLSSDPEAPSKGYAPSHGFMLSRKPVPDTVWSHYGVSFVILTEADIRKRFPHVSTELKYGVSYSTFTLESSRYLPYLKKEIESMGGKFIKTKLRSLYAIAHKYDMIINCSGLGARELVNDERVFPIRGQVLYVKAPWIKEFIFDLDVVDGHLAYVIPNIDHVILGATKNKDSYNLEPNPESRQLILENTKKLIPSIEKAEIIGDGVGLRPGRDEIRLEAESLPAPIPGGKIDRKITVIHNYGHGPAGITMSWGCAENVVELMEQHSSSVHQSSKL